MKPCLALGCLLAGLSAGNAVDFHVALDGDDRNPGNAARPFATLERAQAAVRQAKAGGLPSGGLTVWVHGGDHLRRGALRLTDEDSGSMEAPVVWRGVPGEKARLLGGIALSAWQAVSDAAVRDRLPAVARQQVVECDLGNLATDRLGAMQSRGFGRPTRAAHCELFFAGHPMTLARWPNEGEWTTIAGIPEGAGSGDGHGRTIGDLAAGFLYAGDRPRGWQPSEDLWVHGYWAWDWANSYERVAALDPEKRLVKTAEPYGLYGFRPGQRFHFLNVLEELDQPGEWFLDRGRGRLFWWPPGVRDSLGHPGKAVQLAAWLSLLDQPLIELEGASQVSLEGLVFEATRASAVRIHGGEGNRVVGCVLRNLGNWGVRIEGGAGHGVIGCEILDTGDGGVSLSGGNRDTLEAAGHFVENCHFARQGRWSKCYVPAIQMSGVGHRAAHNLIHDHPHCAILYGGNDHLIEFNEIHHIALETGDVGAIYAGRDYTFRGNRIRHNFIHHTGGVGMGSMGVYMDDCVSGTEIFGNVFYKVQRAAFLGGGRDHQVINNLFVDCNHAVEIDGRGLDPSPVWHHQSDRTLRERLEAVPLSLYRTRYPALRALDRYYGSPDGPPITGEVFKGVPAENNRVERNLCVGKWLHIYWHAQADAQQITDNLTTGDLGLVGPVNDGAGAAAFRVRPDSPAWASGFEPLPVERMGLRRDAVRREVEWLQVNTLP
ncbi:MAG: right-handed parallel beta-helix repeat-containing protein [Verrucomicrobiales bacterium]|nr:right-handed parallel beta-helix repeat-containing protein [Verrucomicrobiales bacterium]